MTFGRLWRLVRSAADRSLDDEIPRMAAAIAFYTVFSLAPLVVLAISVASFFLDASRAQQELIAQAGAHLGSYGARVVEGILRDASERSTVVTFASVGVSALGATAVFVTLQDALNRIWRSTRTAASAMDFARSFLRKRLVSLSLVLGLGLILFCSMTLASTLAIVATLLPESRWGSEFVRIAGALLALGILCLLFGFCYHILPDAKVGWRDVWPGAIAAAALFTVGKELIAMYLGNASVTSVYGAGGTLAALLVWIYYTAQIFFFGAEMTYLWQEQRNATPSPPDSNLPPPIAGPRTSNQSVDLSDGS